jgi:hypothetical protein
MKIDNSYAAARRYELRRAGEDHGLDPVVPEDYGPVHAVLCEGGSFDGGDYDSESGVWFNRYGHRAACGLTVRLIFPVPFDTNEPDACPRCVDLALHPLAGG